MSKNKIILIGGGGHCKSCIEVIESTNQYEIAGIIDTVEKVGEKILGYPIIGCDNDLEEIRKNYDSALVTIGQIKSASIRIKLFKKIKALNFKLPAIIAATAHVSRHASIGEGTIIMHQAMVNTDVVIGNNCIINTKALIEHDTHLGNHCHISTASVLNGNVSVGNECFVGSNSTFVNGISTVSNIFVGINSVVNKNLKEAGIYVGNPVRKIR